MNYIASITDFFKSPKWVMNLLFGGICMLIPVVGPIVLMGYLITGFWSRQDKRPETFPDFDFGKFVNYLQLGLWPFLVLMVVILVVVFGLSILAMIPSAILGMLAGDNGGFIGILIGLLWLLVYLVMWLVIVMVAAPLTITGTLRQDFMAAMDFKFVKRFCTVMWKEILIAAVFLAAATIVLGTVGMIALCVGTYFAMALVQYASMHLIRQEYDLYLSRGGDPIPPSPKLTDEMATPPPIA